jgi:Swt1-like HEPN
LSNISKVYEHIYRAQLTEEALDRAGRKNFASRNFEYDTVREMLAIDVLDADHVVTAEKMSLVYVTVASFENSVRDLIKSVLLDALGENWWEQGVSEKIRKSAESRMDEEKKIRWHVQRGDDPIRFTMLPNLANVIGQNFDHFEPYLHNIDWVKSIFEVVERSRNVIMHSGSLSDRDIARLGSLMRDWNSQVAI